jgi:hypothetical protein
VKNVGGQSYGGKVNHEFRRPHAYLGPPLGSQAANPRVPLKAGSKAKRVESLKDLREANPDLLRPSVLKPRIKEPLNSLKDEAPVGRIMNSWISRLFPA